MVADGRARERHADGVENAHLGPVHRLGRQRVVSEGRDAAGEFLCDGHVSSFL